MEELVDDDMNIVDLVDSDSEHKEEANCGEKRKPTVEVKSQITNHKSRFSWKHMR